MEDAFSHTQIHHVLKLIKRHMHEINTGVRHNFIKIYSVFQFKSIYEIRLTLTVYMHDTHILRRPPLSGEVSDNFCG
jgi:hypothetical protein